VKQATAERNASYRPSSFSNFSNWHSVLKYDKNQIKEGKADP